jgi:hypothetical protein
MGLRVFIIVRYSVIPSNTKMVEGKEVVHERCIGAHDLRLLPEAPIDYLPPPTSLRQLSTSQAATLLH